MGNRLGEFYISDYLVSDESDLLSEILFKIKFVPTRVEYLYHYKKFEYVGTSPLFDEIEDGHIIPKYELKMKISWNTNELEKVELIKIKEKTCQQNY